MKNWVSKGFDELGKSIYQGYWTSRYYISAHPIDCVGKTSLLKIAGDLSRIIYLKITKYFNSKNLLL